MIATDGAPIEPIVVDSVHMLPGERYDIVLDATVPSETSKIEYFFNRSFAMQKI